MAMNIDSEMGEIVELVDEDIKIIVRMFKRLEEK